MQCLYRAWLLALLCALPVAGVPGAETPEGAGSFSVRNARSLLVDGVYRVSAQVDFALGAKAREALVHGVPLVLEMQIQVVEEREWLWDEVAAELFQRYELRHHALSRRYVVTNFQSGVQRSYYKLSDAFHAIGSLYDLPLLDARLLDEAGRHQVRIRANLDIESLPTPIRLWAYVSSDWTVQSEWYAWPLER